MRGGQHADGSARAARRGTGALMPWSPFLPFDPAEVASLAAAVDDAAAALARRPVRARRVEERFRRERHAGAMWGALRLAQHPVDRDALRENGPDGAPHAAAVGAGVVAGQRAALEWAAEAAPGGPPPDRAEIAGLHGLLVPAGARGGMPGGLRAEDGPLRDSATGRVLYAPAPAARVPDLMDAICAAAADTAVPAALRAAWAHVACAAVRPFHEGTGRVARALDARVMHAAGLHLPGAAVPLEPWGERPLRYHALFACLGPAFDPGTDVTAFVRGRLEAGLDWLHAIDRRERIDAEEWTAAENVAVDHGLPERLAHALIEAFGGRPVAAGAYRRVAGVSPATATTDLARAAAAGLLAAEGARRGRRYLPGPALAAEVAAAAGVDAAPGDARRAVEEAIAARLALAP